MKTISFFIILIGLLIFTSCEKEESNDIDNTPATALDATLKSYGWDYNYKLASTPEELALLMDNPKANIVRSVDDFKRFVKTEPILNSVFADERMFEVITKSMKFNRKGLQTYSYEALRKAYPNRFRTIIVTMSKGFGMDLWLTTDYDDMYCASAATCKPDTFSICIGNNC